MTQEHGGPGFEGSVLPPLTITVEDMDWFLSAIRRVLLDTLRVPGAAWDTVMALAKGAAHPENKERYRARAAMLRGRSLDGAIATVERWYATERKAFQIASLFGRPPRLALMVLSEARLMLRLFRRKGMGRQFPALVETLCGPRAADRTRSTRSASSRSV